MYKSFVEYKRMEDNNNNNSNSNNNDNNNRNVSQSLDEMNELIVDENGYSNNNVHDQKEESSLFIFLSIILGLANASDAIEILSAGYVVEEMKKKQNVSETSIGFMTSSVFIGMLCGGFISGVIGDRYGRRKVLLYALVCF